VVPHHSHPVASFYLNIVGGQRKATIRHPA
jgi:hypothetical protein